MIETYRSLLNAGLSFAPIVGDKKCPTLRTWREFEQRQPTEEEITKWASKSENKGIFIFCGEASGHLEVMDFDDKYHNGIYDEWLSLVPADIQKELEKYPLIRTRSNGYHLYYRIPSVPKESKHNSKLANDPNPVYKDKPKGEDTRSQKEKNKCLVTIETRAHGGGVVAPPTHGYTLIRGSLTDIPEMSAELRDQLHAYAVSLNTYIEKSAFKEFKVPKQTVRGNTGDRPGDVYEQNESILDVLLRNGWHSPHQRGDNIVNLTRPGKDYGVSGSILTKDGKSHFHCFSSSASPLEPSTTYTGFGLYTLFEHDGDFKKATKAVAEKYNVKMPTVVRPVQSVDVETEEVYDLDAHPFITSTNKDGDVTYPIVQFNINLAIGTHPTFKNKYRLNLFTFEHQVNDRGAWRERKDEDLVYAHNELSRVLPLFASCSKFMVEDALTKLSTDNAVDPVVDWLNTTKWDGTSRLSSWLSTALGVENTDYISLVGKSWIHALVARQIYPGTKFDQILTLSGKQGTGKTTMFEILGFGHTAVVDESVANKDTLQKTLGKLVINLDEGTALRKSDMKRVKTWSSEIRDEFRLPFERRPRKFLRRFVIAMTENDEEILTDITGNRRFWTVSANGRIDRDWLLKNREQLFAEAMELVRRKEEIQLVPDDMLEHEQEKFVLRDEWCESVQKFLNTQTAYCAGSDTVYYSVSDIYFSAINKREGAQASDIRWDEGRRIARVMKSLGFEQVVKKVLGTTQRVWVMSDKLKATMRAQPSPLQELKTLAAEDF